MIKMLCDHGTESWKCIECLNNDNMALLMDIDNLNNMVVYWQNRHQQLQIVADALACELQETQRRGREMTLSELKAKVDQAIEHAIECGDTPENIDVSLQIDGPGRNSTWASDIELFYDNNGNASGCVLVGYIECIMR